MNTTLYSQSGEPIPPLFVYTTGPFVMPNSGADVGVDVETSQGYSAGQMLFVDVAGYMSVTSIGSATQLRLRNIGDAGNAAPTTAITTDKKITYAGPRGAAGTNGTNGTNGATGATGAGAAGSPAYVARGEASYNTGNPSVAISNPGGLTTSTYLVSARKGTVACGTLEWAASANTLTVYNTQQAFDGKIVWVQVT